MQDLNELVKAFEQNETDDALKAAMEQSIDWYIKHQFETLVQLLYRLDVNEQKFKKALQAHNPDQLPKALTLLIIEKIQERAYWRSKFKKGDEG